MADPIYLDHNATTPVAPEVADAMEPVLRDGFGNPSSTHVFGRRAHDAIARAREQVAALVGCEADEVVFTSGGTESDNAAIVGVAEASAGRGRHIVTTSIEHPAVDATCTYLERRGWSVSRVGVDRDGVVDVAAVESELRDDTTLLTVMHANNETGVMQPLSRLAAAARERGVVFHTDAAQSVGKLPVNVDALGVDLLTLAGHKLYAPKGIGVLVVRRGTSIHPFLHGAGHEAGRRAGTENTSQIVGLGVACELARRESDSRPRHLSMLRQRLCESLERAHPDLVVHGRSAERLPNTLSVAFPRADANRVLERLDGVAAAAGAACHAGHSEPSAVLTSMGVDPRLAVCTLRLSVGRQNTTGEIDLAARRIAEAVQLVRGG